MRNRKKCKFNDKKQVELYLRHYLPNVPNNIISALIAQDYTKVYNFVNHCAELEFLVYYYDCLLNE